MNRAKGRNEDPGFKPERGDGHRPLKANGFTPPKRGAYRKLITRAKNDTGKGIQRSTASQSAGNRGGYAAQTASFPNEILLFQKSEKRGRNRTRREIKR